MRYEYVSVSVGPEHFVCSLLSFDGLSSAKQIKCWAWTFPYFINFTVHFDFKSMIQS